MTSAGTSKSPFRFVTGKAVYLPLLAGLLYSLASNFFGWDLALESHFWDGQACRWTGHDQPVYNWLYVYGILPALVGSVGALLLLIAGQYVKVLRRYSKVCLYLFLVLAIGNGIITNALLKELWGRPRPSQITQFGGEEPFEPSLTIDLDSRGKSFPCGHATMGFYFFAVALLLRRKARAIAFSFALLFGLAIGAARMSFGGHFSTDVVWAAIVMWLTALTLYKALDLDQSLLYTQKPAKNKAQALRRKLYNVFLLPVFFLLILTVSLTTPRDKTDTLSLQFSTAETQSLQLELTGLLKIETNSEPFRMSTHGVGFGFPKTRLLLKQSYDEARHQTQVRHAVRGYFTELEATTELYLPAGHRYELHIDDSELSGLELDGQKLELTEPIVIDLRQQN